MHVDWATIVPSLSRRRRRTQLHVCDAESKKDERNGRNSPSSGSRSVRLFPERITRPASPTEDLSSPLNHPGMATEVSRCSGCLE